MVFEDALLSGSRKSTSAKQGEPATEGDNQAGRGGSLTDKLVSRRAPNVESRTGMVMVAKLSQEFSDCQASPL